MEERALLAAGDLDPTFGVGGIVRTVFPSEISGSVSDLAVQPDGRLLAVGHAGDQVILARYTASGDLDPTFDQDGLVAVDLGGSDPSLRAAVALQADGRILVGASSFSDRASFVVARLNPDGSPDGTFGFGGHAVHPVPGAGRGDLAWVADLAVQPDGRILVAGNAGNEGATIIFALARLDPGGALDPSFGSAGFAERPFLPGSGFDEGVHSVLVQPDGRVVLAGSVQNAVGLARYAANGTLDPSFDGDGRATRSNPLGALAANAAVLQPDGGIVTAGSSTVFSTEATYFSLARFQSDGSPDLAFGAGGLVTDTSRPGSAFYGVGLQANGQIVAGGTTSTSRGTAFAVQRYFADGSPDFEFGSNGTTVTDFGVARSEEYALTIQADGRIVAAGWALRTGSFSVGETDFALARYLPGDSGVIQFDPASYTAFEDSGMVRITLTRTGGAEGTVTVRVATVDGTARAGVDYVAVNTTLTFLPGQTSATLDIELLDDLVLDADETFAVVLSAPVRSRATIGPNRAATVTIAETNPFVVTSTADGNVPLPPVGTLRRAILAANANPGRDSISFQIPTEPGSASNPVRTIAPVAPLPSILESLTIDGYTQPGSRANTMGLGSDAVVLVELSGERAGEANGLVVAAPDVSIRGLAIHRFGLAGIAVVSPASRTLIQGNILGLGADGRAPQGDSSDGVRSLGNGAYGILIANSGDNLIGGTSPGDRNLISGQFGAEDRRGVGVQISGPGSVGNRVQNNYIGTDASGTLRAPNGTGIILDSGASGNLIGGTAAGAGNVLSGNLLAGLQILGGGTPSEATRGNVVQGNRIGTDASGTASVFNFFHGIFVGNSEGNVIGGTEPGAGNLISGNGDPNRPAGDPDDPSLVANQTGVGVYIAGRGSRGNVVQGNRIGTDASGLRPVFARDAQGRAVVNSYIGVLISDASGNTVGGQGDGAGNLISANRFVGVIVFAQDDSPPADGRTLGAQGNVIAGNVIGLGSDGRPILGADGIAIQDTGVLIQDASFNTVGGAAAAARNVISGNAVSGIVIRDDLSTPVLRTESNTVQNNFIGTDAAGAGQPVRRGGRAVTGNGGDGVLILNSANDQILANVISGNGRNGIHLAGPATRGTVILDNLIGLTADRAPLGNGEYGVLVQLGAADVTLPGIGARRAEIRNNRLGQVRFVNNGNASPFGRRQGAATALARLRASRRVERFASQAQPRLAGGRPAVMPQALRRDALRPPPRPHP